MPEQLGSPSCAGLFTADRAPVPLEGVSIDAEISSLCARVSVSQRYVNHETHPIEAVYVFPLDEGAAVCGFEAIIDGTLVVGEIKEREDAFRMYDDAIERGDGAFLLDEERPDVFQASVGNLPPGKEVLLKLTYVTELTVTGDGLRFMIPTTVSPRYAPPEDYQGVGRPDASTLNPPVAWEVAYGLNLSVQLNMTGAITKLDCPSHPVSVSMQGHAASVTLSKRDAALDRDFVLSVDVEGLNTPQAWIEHDGTGHHAVAVAFVPRFERDTIPCDVTFLVDRSGSMEGTSIEEVRNALQLCLRSLVSGCTFNIVGFGSSHEVLFPLSRSYDDASLAEASAHVASMRANLGGTEVLPALRAVLEQPRVEGRVRQVVLLTDGQVTNTDAVLALVAAHAVSARVFTFGIGAGASQHLVKAIARASGGSAEFIHPGERIEPKVVRQLGRLLSPGLTDVAMSWGGLNARQAPAKLPPVFAGDRLLLYAFFSEVWRSQAPTQATLTATSANGPVSFPIMLNPADIVDGRAVATLAARARIRELEESPEWTTPRGSRQHDRKVSGVSKEIIELSTRYGLISRETSFVAIERRDTPVTGDMQLRRVPIALTAGWGGLNKPATNWIQARYGAVVGSRLTLGAPAAAAIDEGVVARARMLTLDEARRSVGAGPPQPRTSGAIQRGWDKVRSLGRRPSEPDTATPLTPGADRLHSSMVALIALQSADGSWELTADLARAVGHDLDSLERALQGATRPVREARTAWATALALAWLDDHARSFEEEWGRAAAKGSRWLRNVQAKPAGGGTWMEATLVMRPTPSPQV